MNQKTLIIAEKFDMAKNKLAPMLEKVEGESFIQKKGYLEGQRFVLSWCVGHLMELAGPEEYGWKEKTVENLPMFPSEFKMKVSHDTKDQYQILVKLCKEVSSIINAGDAAREGELIVREVVESCGCAKKLSERLWMTSTTFKGLKDAWERRKPSSNFDGYYHSAMARSKGDWVVGMNFSRGYSLMTGAMGLSVGRVQSALLQLICDRDHQIENWKKTYFYECHIDWNDIDLSFVDENGNREFEKDLIPKKMCYKVDGEEGILKEFKKTKKSTEPKRPFDLTQLQKSGYNQLGLTSDKTLEVAQSLYEKKIITYPRSDYSHLTEDSVGEAWRLAMELSVGDEAEFFRDMRDDHPIFNDKKVGDHSGIIPTGEMGEMNELETKLYEIIRSRFVMAFMKPEKYMQYEILVDVNGHQFKGNVYQEIDAGWKGFARDEKNEKSDQWINGDLEIVEGKTALVRKPRVEEKQRTKPKHYNDGNIIEAMETAGKHVEDDDLRDAMKEKGLGTSATRAQILKALVRKSYIERKGKVIVATQKGKSLVKTLDPRITSPELTGQWEYELKKIEQGKGDAEEFLEDIIYFVDEHLKELLSNGHLEIEGLSGSKIKCPKCKKSMNVNDHGAFCSGCDYKLWRKVFGKKLSDLELEQLIDVGMTDKAVSGLRKFDKVKKKFVGDKYKAKLELKDDKVMVFFENTTKRFGFKKSS